MLQDPIALSLNEAIRRRSETPARDRFEAMVRRGIIDDEGRVLFRSPNIPDSHEAAEAAIASKADQATDPKRIARTRFKILVLVSKLLSEEAEYEERLKPEEAA